MDRPWPSSSRLGTYGIDGHAEAAQGQGHDGQTRQTVGIEVAEDEDASRRGRARVPAVRGGRRRRAGDADRGGRRRARPSHAARSSAVATPRAARMPASRGPSPLARPSIDRRAAGRRTSETPAEAGFEHGVRMPRGLHRGLFVGPMPVVVRTPCAGRAGCARGVRRPCRAVLPELPVDQQRRGDEDRRVRPRDDADEQGQDEVLDRRATEQQQREQRQHDGQAGHDRAPERLQDRVVHDLGERLAGVAGLVLADPVEDDDRVVDAEADDGQHRGHEQAVDLDAEERARGSRRCRRRR